MIKGFRQIAFLTTVSRIFGFVRDVAYSHFFGATALLDAWAIAFKIPNLARRLFGEGAVSASLIPVYSEELTNKPEQAKYLANTVVTFVFVLLAVVVLLGQLAIWGYYNFFCTTSETKLVLSLSSIMLPYMVLVCITAILGGILNVHRHFATPAAAPIVLNLCIIGSIVLTGWVFDVKPQQQVFFVAVAVVIAGLAQIAIQIVPLRYAGVSIRPAWQINSEPFRKIVILMGPMIIGLTATQINTLADDLIAWFFSGSAEKGMSFLLFGKEIAYPLQRGSVSHLYFAQRLYQLPLGIFGISLATAIFPVMSAYASKKDFQGLSKTVSQGFCAAIFIAIPASIGLIAVARPLISVAFEHGKFGQLRDDTAIVTKTLWFYSLGLSGYFAQHVAARVFYALQDSKTPMRSALIAVAVNIILNLTLIWFLGTAGLALATALCAYLQVGFLTIALRRYLRKLNLHLFLFKGFRLTLIKTIAAASAMSATVLITLSIAKSWGSITKLLFVVPLSAAVYLLTAKLLHIEMLSLLITAKRSNDEQPCDI